MNPPLSLPDQKFKAILQDLLAKPEPTDWLAGSVPSQLKNYMEGASSHDVANMQVLGIALLKSLIYFNQKGLDEVIPDLLFQSPHAPSVGNNEDQLLKKAFEQKSQSMVQTLIDHGFYLDDKDQLDAVSSIAQLSFVLDAPYIQKAAPQLLKNYPHLIWQEIIWQAGFYPELDFDHALNTWLSLARPGDEIMTINTCLALANLPQTVGYEQVEKILKLAQEKIIPFESGIERLIHLGWVDSDRIRQYMVVSETNQALLSFIEQKEMHPATQSVAPSQNKKPRL